MKIFIVIIAFFSFWPLNAQFEWTPAKVILKNGESFRGLIKFPENNNANAKFRYKKRRKSQVERLGSDTVEEVVFGDEEFTTVHYEYIPIGKNKFVLMELVVSGEVSLYSRAVFKSFFISSGNMSKTYYHHSKYYLKKDSQDIAKKIPRALSKLQFIKFAKNYFSNCNKIVDYLDSKLYTKEDIIDLVNDYNLLCY